MLCVLSVTLYPINEKVSALKTHLLTPLFNVVWCNTNVYAFMMVLYHIPCEESFQKYKHLLNQSEITVS